MTNKNEKLVEIARSFSYKLNTGNYESRDFFCSQKCECLEEEAEVKSKKLYEFCKKEVWKAVKEYKELMKKSEERKDMLTVEEWEKMTPEEQAMEQEKKKENNRAKYQENKTHRCITCRTALRDGQECSVCKIKNKVN